MNEIHDKLSYSQINNFHNCPRKWSYQYIDNIKTTGKSIYLEYGSAVHYVLENMLRYTQNKDFKTELGSSISDIRTNGLEYVTERIKDFKGEDLYDLTQLADSEFKRYLNKEGFYAEILDDNTKIEGVEEPFSLEIQTLLKGKEVVFTLRGFIDLVYRDRNGLVVVDHKTSKSKFQKKKRRDDLQLPIYFMAIHQKYGEYPYKGVYNFTKLNIQQETTFTPKVTRKMEEAMNERNPKIIYGTDPQQAKKEIIQTFKDMNNEKKRRKANPSPLCYFCDYKQMCDKASDWVPKDKR